MPQEANEALPVFIIEGVLTIVAGFIAPFFLVDCKSTPSKAAQSRSVDSLLSPGESQVFE